MHWWDFKWLIQVIYDFKIYLFSTNNNNKSKNAYKMLSHSTNLKSNKKEGSIATCFFKDGQL